MGHLGDQICYENLKTDLFRGAAGIMETFQCLPSVPAPISRHTVIAANGIILFLGFEKPCLESLGGEQFRKREKKQV